MKRCFSVAVIFLLGATIVFAQIYKDPSYSVEERVEDLLSRMTLNEKIGQMTQPNSSDCTPGDVTTYYLGSVLSGGSDGPSNSIPSSWADFHDNYQSGAMATRLGIPILYGIDSVHGMSHSRGTTIFPHNIGLGAAGDPDLVREVGRITAKEQRGCGIEWAFGPC
ncbi:MAG: hypothetical protein JXJ04_08320, partial [Spirochaetales bacterium]|nr:hypothetical protein [Spirochaetales bacterium]